MKMNLSTSQCISALFAFYKCSTVPIAELGKMEDQFEETGAHNGTAIWTPRIAKSEEEVRFFNETLMDWVWHFRDFFCVHAEQHLGMTRKTAQAITDAAVAASDSLKLCGYFTNLRKHVRLDNFKHYPTFRASPPRLGDVRVHFVGPNGDTVYMTDMIGAEAHQSSSRLSFLQTVQIEDFPGDLDTRRVVEEASWVWIDLLKAHGIDLGVSKPLWFAGEPMVIDYIGMGTSPKAMAARRVPWPEGLVGTPVEWDELDMWTVSIVGGF